MAVYIVLCRIDGNKSIEEVSGAIISAINEAI